MEGIGGTHPARTFALGAVLLLFFTIIPVWQDTSGGDIDTGDHFTIRFSTDIMTVENGLELALKSISIGEGEIIVGLSNGAAAESVTDSDPGSPMIPLLATTVSIPGRITDAVMISGEWEMSRTRSGIRLVPEATNPWEGRPPVKYLEGKPPAVPDVEFHRIGYRHINGELLTTYSLWIRAVKALGPRTISHSEEATVVLRTEEDAGGPTPTRLSGDPEQVPGTLSITPYTEVRPQYLIITSGDLEPKLQKLADWKSSLGIATSVVTVEDIISSYRGSTDVSDLIREYLKDVLERWGVLEYVLLAGDWDVVPTKRIVDSDPYPGWDDGYIPADSYYQCLDGTWDSDGDGVFGEIGDVEDIIPDLSVSRLAINDPGKWVSKIDQIISYEKGKGGYPNGDKALMIGANTHNEGDGSDHSEYLWEKYGDEAYASSVDLYEDQGTLSNSGIHNNINNGVGFVNFIDHGGPNEWCDDYGKGVVYRSRDARSLNNGNSLPFVSTLACLTTWFDDTSGSNYNFNDCIGEAFTENTEGGAVGYVGSSRTSVGILGAGRYLPYDNGLQEDMIREIAISGEPEIGKLYSGAKTHYAEIWGGRFANENNPEVMLCWMEYTLLGEVATPLRMRDPPETGVDIFHEDDLDPHILISVEDGSGNPLEGANVTLMNFKRSVYSRDDTDSSGEAVFDLELDWFCEINLSVTMRDRMVYSGHIRISDVIPPETRAETFPEEPHGDNGWFLEPPLLRLVPDEEAVVHYRSEGSGYLATNSSMNYSVNVSGQGVHEIHYFAEDIAGNLEEERHLEVKVDTEDPSFEVSVSPKKPDGLSGIYTIKPLISMVIPESDPGSHVSYLYSVNGGEPGLYQGSFFLEDGDHVIEFWAVDESGRVSNHTYLNLTVDTQPPETVHELDPGSPDRNGWYTQSPTLRLMSTDEVKRIEYRLSEEEDFSEYSGSFKLPDGTYAVEYRSVDMAGNVEETHEFDVKVDTTPPDISYTIDPAEPDGEEGYYLTTPRVVVEWEDNIGADLREILNGGGDELSEGRSVFDNGEHSVTFYAVDRAGLESEKIELDIKVDTETPETETRIIGRVNDGWYSTMPIISLESSEVCSISYGFDEGDFQDYYMPIEPPGREGVFILRYRGVDLAGNREREKTEKIRVDTVKPRLSFTHSEIGEYQYRFDLSDSEDGNDWMEFRITQGDRILSGWNTDEIVKIVLDPGRHQLTLETRDRAGNIDEETVVLNVEKRVDVIRYALWGIPAAAILLLALIASMIFIGRRRSDPVYHDVSEPLLYDRTEKDEVPGYYR